MNFAVVKLFSIFFVLSHCYSKIKQKSLAPILQNLHCRLCSYDQQTKRKIMSVQNTVDFRKRLH